MYKCKIIKGKGLGTRIGFPTINCKPYTEIREDHGIYIVDCLVNTFHYFGIANWGNRPSINDNEVLLEIHILQDKFQTDKFIMEINVNFLKYLRAGKKFESIEDLACQIQKDKNMAIRYLEGL